MGDYINFINYAINLLSLWDVFAKCTRAQQQAIEATNRNWCIQVKTVTDSVYSKLDAEQLEESCVCQVCVQSRNGRCNCFVHLLMTIITIAWCSLVVLKILPVRQLDPFGFVFSFWSGQVYFYSPNKHNGWVQWSLVMAAWPAFLETLMAIALLWFFAFTQYCTQQTVFALTNIWSISKSVTSGGSEQFSCRLQGNYRDA